MPYRSEAQRRFMYWAESKGKIPKGTAAKWSKETGKKKLPETVKKSESFYLSLDGDNIGKKVELAEISNDENQIQEISNKIRSGQKLFEEWAKQNNGYVVEGGGDEALLNLPELNMNNIEDLKNKYRELVGATVTIGIGKTISQAAKARMYGKMTGKNKIAIFNDEIDQFLKDSLQKDLEDKLLEFFDKNPNPSDEEVHNFAKENQIEPDKLEEIIYSLINKLNVLDGLAKEKGTIEEDVNPKELEMGIKVEYEHTKDKETAKQIALDHLTEIPDYYTRLKEMEDKALKKAERTPIPTSQFKTTPTALTGEGSRGGHIIGHTSSGAPIYGRDQLYHNQAKKVLQTVLNNHPELKDHVSGLIKRKIQEGHHPKEVISSVASTLIAHPKLQKYGNVINKSGFDTVINAMNYGVNPSDFISNILAKIDKEALPYLALLREKTKDLKINTPIDFDLYDWKIHIFNKEPGVYDGYLLDENDRKIIEFDDQTLPIIASMIQAKVDEYYEDEIEEVIPEKVIIEAPKEEIEVFNSEDVKETSPKIEININQDGSINIQLIKSLVEKIIDLNNKINKINNTSGEVMEKSFFDSLYEKLVKAEQEGDVYVNKTDYENGKQFWYKTPEGKFVEKENAPEGHEDFDATKLFSALKDKVQELETKLATITPKTIEQKIKEKYPQLTDEEINQYINKAKECLATKSEEPVIQESIEVKQEIPVEEPKIEEPKIEEAPKVEEVKKEPVLKKSRLQRMWKVFNIEMPEKIDTKEELKKAHNGYMSLKTKIEKQGKNESSINNIVNNTLEEKYGDLYKSILDYKEEKVIIPEPIKKSEELTKEIKTDLNDRIKEMVKGSKLDFTDMNIKEFNEETLKKSNIDELECEKIAKSQIKKNWDVKEYTPTTEKLEKHIDTNLNEETIKSIVKENKKSIEFNDLDLKAFNPEEIKTQFNKPLNIREKKEKAIKDKNWKI